MSSIRPGPQFPALPRIPILTILLLRKPRYQALRPTPFIYFVLQFSSTSIVDVFMAEVMAAVEIASSALAALKALYQVYIWAQEIRHCHEDIAEFVQLVDDVADQHQKLRNIRIKLRGSKAPAAQIGGCLDSERRAWVHLAKADKILVGVYKDGQKDWQSSLLSFLVRERWIRRIKEESRECRHDLNTCFMMLSHEVTNHVNHANTLGKLDEGFKSTTSQIDMIRATLNSSRGQPPMCVPVNTSSSPIINE